MEDHPRSTEAQNYSK